MKKRGNTRFYGGRGLIFLGISVPSGKPKKGENEEIRHEIENGLKIDRTTYIYFNKIKITCVREVKGLVSSPKPRRRRIFAIPRRIFVSNKP